MKKKLILITLCFFTFSAYAQDVYEDGVNANIDWSEDSTDVTTINDIINQQQKVFSNRSTDRHFSSVWGRRSYINLSFNNTTLSPKDAVPTGVDGTMVKDMKSDWGVSFQYGRSYRFHKTPISNVLQFNFDFTGIDLNVNHFKAEGNGKGLYDSRNKIEIKQNYKTESYFYMPWNMEKYEFSFGMALGPSITLAPFTSVNSQGLHFLKFNFYYHIGYHISLIYMPNDKDADLNTGIDTENTYSSTKNKEDMADNLKMEWGHGLMQTFGLNVSWKAIGLGFEYRTASAKYKAMSTNSFGSDKYKFGNTSSRIYIQFRM